MKIENIDNLFHDGLNSHSAQPSHDLWDAISSKLDAMPPISEPAENAPIDNVFKTKLSEHSVTPPESAWQNISAGLNTPPVHPIDRTFYNQLYNTVIEPPVAIWTNIRAAVSRHAIIRASLKYAATVAASIAVLLIGFNYYYTTAPVLRPYTIAETSYNVEIPSYEPLTIITSTEPSSSNNLPTQNNLRAKSPILSNHSMGVLVATSSPTIPINIEPSESTTTTELEASPEVSITTVASNNNSTPVIHTLKPLSSSSLVALQEPQQPVTKPTFIQTTTPTEFNTEEALFIDNNNRLISKGSMDITKPSRWSFGIMSGPNVSYRHLHGMMSKSQEADFNKAERPLVSFSTGVLASYNLTSHWAIQTGLYYSQVGQRINNVYPKLNTLAVSSSNGAYNKSTIQTTSGMIASNTSLKSYVTESYDSYFSETTTGDEVANALNPDIQKTVAAQQTIYNMPTYTLTERLDYVEIPISIAYKFNLGRFSMALSTGTVVDILANNQVYLRGDKTISREGNLLSVRKLNYGMMAGIDISVCVGERTAISLSPIGKYLFRSYTTNALSHPYAAAAYIGIRYRL